MQDLHQDPGNHKGVNSYHNNAHHLCNQLGRTAGKQSVHSTRINCLGGKDAKEQSSNDSAHAVDPNYVQRIVIAQAGFHIYSCKTNYTGN